MKKSLLFLSFFFLTTFMGRAQCPLIYDYLGTLTTTPNFISCTGSSYALNFQSNSSWGTYTINWGDLSSPTTGTSYAANSIIPHTYPATNATYTITLIIPALSCTLTGFVAVEQAVFAGVIVTGGVALACAPKTLTFSNVSTFTSATTSYTWNWGDGSPLEVYTYTNAGQNVTHTYQKGTVNCQTQVILQAQNFCTFGAPTFGQVNPLYVYDIDDAMITADRVVRCWPDNTFSFSNTTARNCVPQGNTFQRQEKWRFLNYFGLGQDSIVGWNPWPPSNVATISYSAIGSYSVTLLDSNLCGIDVETIVVSIINPPTSSLIIPSGNLCQNTAITFTNAGTPGNTYKWNFGTGGGFVNLGSGNKSNTYTTPGTFTVKLVCQVAGGGNACSDTSSAVITILASPVSNFSLTPTVGCNTITNVVFTDLSAGAVAWNWTFGNGNTSNAPNPPPQNYAVVGTIVASLVVTGSTSCSHTHTASLIIYPKPLPDFVQFSACVGAAIQFTNTSAPTAGSNSITGYTWDFGDGSTLSSSLNPTHTYTAPLTYTVKLVAASAFCIDSISKTVVLNIKPTANFVSTPTLGCPPLPVTFSNTTLNGSTYLWKFQSTASPSSSAVSPTHTFANTSQSFQNYTVTLYASTGIGCNDSIKQVISVKPRPVANFTSNINAGCSPFLATFTNTGLGGFTYSWTLGDGGTASGPNPSHTYTNSSLFQQTVTVQQVATNSVGCSDSISKPLIIYAKPSVNFTMLPSSGCHPLVVMFPAVPGVATYSWTHGDASPQYTTNNAPHTHTYINTGSTNKTFTTSLIANNVSGCIDSAKGTIVVFPKPVAGLVLTPTVGCSPHSVTFLGSNNLINSTYLWKFGDSGLTFTTGVSSGTTHIYTNVNPTTNQTFTSSVVVVSANGCRDSAFKSVLVYFKPEAKFALDTPKCASRTITFFNSSIGSFSQTWDFGDLSPLSTVLYPTHTYANNSINNKTYTVQLIVTSVSSCKDTALGYPVLYAKPVANFSVSPNPGCAPLVTTFTSTGINAHTYFWKFGDGATSSLSTLSHTYVNPSNSINQTYNAAIVAYNNNGCRDSVTKSVLVFYKPFADFTLDTPACSPKLITFTNKSLGATTFNWDFGNGQSSTATSTVSQNYVNNTGSNLFYFVSLIARTINNCSDTSLVPIVVHPKPSFFISSAPDSGCSPLNVRFSKIQGVAKYAWTFEPGNYSSKDEITNTFVNTGSATKVFTVQLIADDAYHCIDTATKIIKVFPKPTAKFTASPLNVYIPVDATKCFNLSSGASSYRWSFGDGNTSTETEPTHNYTRAGEFQIILIAANNKGCLDTFSLPELVIALSESEVEIPNAFSPNLSGSPGTIYDPEDRSNDIFHPNVKGADQYELSIYSRWGELLFETKNPKEGWDGYYKDKLCVQDVYVWKVVATFLDGKRVVKTGDVLLLR